LSLILQSVNDHYLSQPFCKIECLIFSLFSLLKEEKYTYGITMLSVCHLFLHSEPIDNFYKIWYECYSLKTTPSL
jgi:hypothetical protein